MPDADGGGAFPSTIKGFLSKDMKYPVSVTILGTSLNQPLRFQLEILQAVTQLHPSFFSSSSFLHLYLWAPPGTSGFVTSEI